MVMMPRVVSKGMSIREHIVFTCADNLAEDRCLSAAFAANHEGPSVSYSLGVGLVTLKGLIQQVIGVGVRSAKGGDLKEGLHDIKYEATLVSDA